MAERMFEQMTDTRISGAGNVCEGEGEENEVYEMRVRNYVEEVSRDVSHSKNSRL